jgi:hypothetical protein
MTERDAMISGLRGRVNSLEADLAVAFAQRQALLAACQRFLDAHQAAMNGIGMQDKLCQCGPCVEARAAVAEVKDGDL